jgi:hypothetical protein
MSIQSLSLDQIRDQIDFGLSLEARAILDDDQQMAADAFLVIDYLDSELARRATQCNADCPF